MHFKCNFFVKQFLTYVKSLTFHSLIYDDLFRGVKVIDAIADKHATGAVPYVIS